MSWLFRSNLRYTEVLTNSLQSQCTGVQHCIEIILCSSYIGVWGCETLLQYKWLDVAYGMAVK